MISFLNPTKQRTHIGLDLGATAVRAAQLSRSGDVWTLDSYSRCACSRSEDASGFSCLQREREIAICTRQARFRGRRLIAGIGSPEVQFVSMELPDTIGSGDQAQAGDVVRWEVQRLINAGDDATETAHWMLPRSKATDLNAIGVAASSQLVAQLVAMCDRAGGECVCVDASATALVRFGAVLRRWGEDSIWGVLDVGHRQARLVLCREHTPILVRVVGSGGESLTQQIADALKISVASAEIHKRDYGITCPSGVGGREKHTSEGSTKEQPKRDNEELGGEAFSSDASSRSNDATGVGSVIMDVLRKDLHHLVEQINRSYEYVLSCYPSCQASDLILVGGGSALQDLPALLGGELRVPVRLAGEYLGSASCRLRCLAPARASLESFALSIGLALDP